MKRLTISTPGRICLFGEHQDYLGLPVIPAAISRRISVTGERIPQPIIELDLPDIGQQKTIPLRPELPYQEERDYFRSSLNILYRRGYRFSGGFRCRLRGNIPINSGTSSSSALVVTWIHWLTLMSEQGAAPAPAELARLAHAAEVVEFNEPGGMMDHYSTVVGKVIHLSFVPEIQFESLDCDLKTFVLGNSGQPKDTKGILARVKNRMLEIDRRLRDRNPEFSLQTATLETIGRYSHILDQEEYELLQGTVRNRQITREARNVLRSKPLDHRRVGVLLTEHQMILREILQISTPKIDWMLDAALEAGAYGGKINGSGGGGCMFAYAPETPDQVAEAIEKAGGKAYIVQVDTGTRVEKSS